VKGSGRGGQHHHQQPASGEEGGFAVHASVYGKVQAEPNVTPNDQERKWKRKMLLLARAGLSGYLCRSGLGGWYPPHRNRKDKFINLKTLQILIASPACD
jgi:hypothetical protein